MSERLRKVYEVKEMARIKLLVEAKNSDHMQRMRSAGKKFRKAHSEVFRNSI